MNGALQETKTKRKNKKTLTLKSLGLKNQSFSGGVGGEDVGSIPGLTQWVKDPGLLQAALVVDANQIWHCCGYGLGI